MWLFFWVCGWVEENKFNHHGGCDRCCNGLDDAIYFWLRLYSVILHILIVLILVRCHALRLWARMILCLSRCHSRSFSAWRLSWACLPLARAISILTRFLLQ